MDDKKDSQNFLQNQLDEVLLNLKEILKVNKFQGIIEISSKETKNESICECKIKEKNESENKETLKKDLYKILLDLKEILKVNKFQGIIEINSKEIKNENIYECKIKEKNENEDKETLKKDLYKILLDLKETLENNSFLGILKISIMEAREKRREKCQIEKEKKIDSKDSLRDYLDKILLDLKEILKVNKFQGILEISIEVGKRNIYKYNMKRTEKSWYEKILKKNSGETDFQEIIKIDYNKNKSVQNEDSLQNNLDKIMSFFKEKLGNSNFLGVISTLFGIVFFIVNQIYKLTISKKYILPSDYFNIDIGNTVFYLIGSIILIPFFISLLVKSKWRRTNILIYIILVFIVTFIFIKTEKLFLCITLYIVALYGAFYVFNIFFKRKIIKIIIFIISLFSMIYSLLIIDMNLEILKNLDILNKILKQIPIELFLSIIIPIILVSLYSAFYEIEFDKEEIKEKVSNHFFILYYILLLVFSLYFIPIIILRKTNYEIFYKNNEPKVIITTYEGKYLIMDCDYDKDKVEITNIYRKNYEFIEMTKAKGLQYIESNKVPEIKNFGKMVKINE